MIFISQKIINIPSKIFFYSYKLNVDIFFLNLSPFQSLNPFGMIRTLFGGIRTLFREIRTIFWRIYNSFWRDKNRFFWIITLFGGIITLFWRDKNPFLEGLEPFLRA